MASQASGSASQSQQIPLEELSVEQLSQIKQQLDTASLDIHRQDSGKKQR
jgi:hypothetical protein